MEIDPLLTSSYDYDLPQHLIATRPTKPPQNCKLLVYDRKNRSIKHEIFYNLKNYIPKETKIFLNDTKVIKARIFGKKSSGGSIELLLNSNEKENDFVVFIRGKVKVGTTIQFDKNLKAIVKKLNQDGTRIVNFYLGSKIIDFNELVNILNSIGHIPLPPYIKRDDDSNDETDYQTIFAKNNGSVAAPTASLHFDKKMLKELDKEFSLHYLTLHIGAGTFKPVESQTIYEHKMHFESYDIPEENITILDGKKPILAIGTTVTRTIETYIRTKKRYGVSDIFLHPLNKPKRVNYLLTNFHLPKSTLIMLVASFIGINECKKVYKEAIKKEYKFYSYGDSMLII